MLQDVLQPQAKSFKELGLSLALLKRFHTDYEFTCTDFSSGSKKNRGDQQIK